MIFSGIYAIVDGSAARDPVAIAEAALDAGIRLLQYRAKEGVEGSVLRALLTRTRAAGATLVINDDLDAALIADGWHAGQEDLAGCDVRAVRARLGPRVFGISAVTPDELAAAEEAGADYVGTGPFAATASKSDAGLPIGAAGIARAVAATRLPVVAIGGIDVRNVDAVARSGAAMAAVISALAQAPDPRAAARDLQRRWTSARA